MQHYATSHYATSHYATSHFMRSADVIEPPIEPIEEGEVIETLATPSSGVYGTAAAKRRRDKTLRARKRARLVRYMMQEEEELILLVSKAIADMMSDGDT